MFPSIARLLKQPKGKSGIQDVRNVDTWLYCVIEIANRGKGV